MNIKLQVFKLCALMLVLAFLNDVTVYAATFTVTSNADNGLNSLRQAILNANASVGVNAENLMIEVIPGTDCNGFNFAVGSKESLMLYEVYTIAGIPLINKVVARNADQYTNRIKLNLSNGIYIVRVSCSNKIIQKKFFLSE